MLQVIGYALVVAALLAAAGFGLEQVLARRQWPRRLAWGLAMLASMLVPLVMISQAQPDPVAVLVEPAAPAPLAVSPASEEQYALPAPQPAPVRAVVPAPAQEAGATPAQSFSSPVSPSSFSAPAPVVESFTRWRPAWPSDGLVLTVWMVVSAALLLYVMGSTALLHYRAARWRREAVLGHEVVVSADTGPAVLGALRPTIIVPRWCLEESESTRRLILQHEQQHVAGRDPLLLWAAMLIVVALPWNLPLWWQLRRLRLAIELDCDARVLRAGANAGHYGEVLLAVTQRAAGLRGLAIAMGQPMSALERRIRNLTRVSPRHAGLRTVGACLVAVGGAAAAAMLNAPVVPGVSWGNVVEDIQSSPVSPRREELVTVSSALPSADDAPVMQAVAVSATGPSSAATTLAAAAAATPAPAATPPASTNPLECLDEDVLRGLLLRPLSQALSVSSQVPAELAAFKPPRELQWVAATERSFGEAPPVGSVAQTAVAAVYRSSLAPEAARNAAAAALNAAGWKLHYDGRSLGYSVFTAGDAPLGSETYCREGQPVNFTSGAVDGVTYVTLSVSRNQGGFGTYNQCDQPPHSVRTAGVLDEFMPKLDLPRDPATGKPVIMRGGGSGGRCDTKCDANIGFTLKESAGNVARHFADQMAAQGWSADSSWSGTGTAGSTWIRKPGADVTMQATLTVSRFDEDRFTVVFKAARTQ